MSMPGIEDAGVEDQEMTRAAAARAGTGGA
jgi:hypothetical protein